MKWALRGLIGFLTLSVILTGTVQIPYVQTRIVHYATEMVTESLGMEMEIGAVDLHLFQRTLTLSDLTCSAGGAEILCGTLDLKYKGANSRIHRARLESKKIVEASSIAITISSDSLPLSSTHLIYVTS